MSQRRRERYLAETTEAALRMAAADVDRRAEDWERAVLEAPQTPLALETAQALREAARRIRTLLEPAG